jgi:hypothetical protein
MLRDGGRGVNKLKAHLAGLRWEPAEDGDGEPTAVFVRRWPPAQHLGGFYVSGWSACGEKFLGWNFHAQRWERYYQDVGATPPWFYADRQTAVAVATWWNESLEALRALQEK